MARDKSILSEKDLHDKTSSMIEFIRDCEIKIEYGRGENYCQITPAMNPDDQSYEFTEDKFKIHLASPAVKKINQYTALIHELGHILYQSPFTPVKKLLNRSDWSKISKIAHVVYNILEDQRIESHLSRNYLAYLKRFQTTRKNLGKEFKSSKNPANMLLAIRFFRDDLVKDYKNYDVFKKALEDVEGMDKFGGLRVLISLKKYLEEYVDERENFTGSDKELTQTIKEVGLEKTQAKDLHTSKETEIPEELLQPSYNNDEIKSLLKDGKTEGEREFEEVINIMNEGTSSTDNMPKNARIVKRIDEEYETNNHVAKKLNGIFKKVKMKYKESIDTEGYDVDVEEYVDRFIDGHKLNKCLINTNAHRGVSIIISIDGSSSMRGQMPYVRELVSTLYKSVKDISNVEIKCNVWASNREGEIGITEVNSKDDIKNISITSVDTSDRFFATPTHMGLEYTRKMLKDMSGERKLVIMITDGVPNYYLKGRKVVRAEYYKKCRKSLQSLLRQTPNIICIAMIGNRVAQERVMELFGKRRVIPVPDWYNASENIIKQFKQMVVSTLI